MNSGNMSGNVSGASGFRNTSNNGQTINSSSFSGSRSGGMGMQTASNSNKISGLSYQEAKVKSTNN